MTHGMTQPMELYFAYGSNMSSRRLSARVTGARSLGRAHLDGWRLAFNKPGRDGSGKANLLETPAGGTWGVLYEIPTDEWSVLDDFEPGYFRTRFRLLRDGQNLAAQAYVFADPRGARPTRPSAMYLAHLLEGASEHELPTHHIEYIRSFL